MYQVHWIGPSSLAIVLACCGAAAQEASSVAAPPQRSEARPAAAPPLMTPEIRRIQEALGGSVVDQALLNPADAKDASPEAKPPAPPFERVHCSRVAALRDAAWKLDRAARVLERLALYDQADGLREHAQRLRLDARAIAGMSRRR